MIFDLSCVTAVKCGASFLLFSALGAVSISIYDEKEKYAKGSLDEVKERVRKKTDSVDRNGKLQIFEMERRSKEVSFCVWSVGSVVF